MVIAGVIDTVEDVTIAETKSKEKLEVSLVLKVSVFVMWFTVYVNGNIPA